jgi:DNA-binding transcriptional LysR family regulator
MELRHLRYFVAVAEELNFTRAAKRLGINQPPLSLQIRQLEMELGTAMFVRRARGIELTNAGKLMLEEARVILKEVEIAKAGVQRRARGETGRIEIGFSGGTYFHPLVPAIIREYRMDYPDVVLFPQASGAALLTAQLRAGQIDIAFIRLPFFDDDIDLVIEPLVDEPSVMVLPTGHPLARADSVPLRAFAKDVFVLYPREINPDVYDSIISAFNRAGVSPVLGQGAPQIASVLPLVAAGLGVSIVPRSMSRILLDGIRYLPIEGDAPRVKICLTYRRDDHAPAIRNFVAVARRAIGPPIAGAKDRVANKPGKARVPQL